MLKAFHSALLFVGSLLITSGSLVAPAEATPTAAPAQQQIIYQIVDIAQSTLVASSDLTGDGSAPLTVNSSSIPLVGATYFEATSIVSGMPFAQSRSSTGSGYYTSVHARLNYQVLISGPSSSLVVPVNYLGRIRVSVSGNPTIGAASAYAQLDIDNTITGTNYEVRDCLSSCIRTASDFLSIQGSILGLTGNVLRVFMSTDVDAYNGATASAYVDPFFAIDPTFLTQNPGYSLSFSQFVGNEAPAGGVPEAPTWAMMLLGFGGVGYTMRRMNTAARIRFA